MMLLADATAVDGLPGGRLITGYVINLNAGSNKFYHGSIGPNFGFYKQIRWSGKKSQPEEIAYVFENSDLLAGGEHHFERHTWKDHGYWGAQDGGPTARHRSLSSVNLIYYDGHAGLLKDRYATDAEVPFIRDP
jgi:hypothetical protein